MNIGEAVRQGDVLLRRIKKMPSRAKRRATGKAPIVVEYGEATGHTHTLDPRTVEAYDVVNEASSVAAQAYYRVLDPTPLEHQEHSALPLDSAGDYERWYQVEDDGESERQIGD